MIKYYLIYIGAMSLIAFILYGADKSKARRHEWRTKESALLGFGLFGGAVGALLGMKLFRHKTKHWYFWLVNIVGLIAQITILILLIMMKKV